MAGRSLALQFTFTIRYIFLLCFDHKFAWLNSSMTVLFGCMEAGMSFITEIFRSMLPDRVERARKMHFQILEAQSAREGR